MKSFIIASIVTVFGLIFFILYDTGKLGSENMIEDEEQTGLSEQITIRFSHVVAENTPKGLAAQKFAQLVSKKTDGKVKVEIYPNGILYSDDEEVEALQRGDVQMIAPSYTKMTDLVPQWKALDLPFLFQNNKHVENIFTGEIGEELLGYIRQKEMLGLAFWSNGFKQMSSSEHPLISPEDFKDQTFRIMSGNIVEKQFRLLQAKPVATSFTEVYSSLEKHTVQGQENTISNIYSKGLYKFQPYITISNHGFLGYAVIINQDFWDSLPKKIQKQIQAAMKETTQWNMENSVEMNEQLLLEMENNSSLTITTLSEKEKEQWKKIFKPLYKETEKEIGSSLIEEIERQDH